MTEEEKLKLVSELKFYPEHYPCQPKGGQQVAMSPKGVRITHEDLNISIYVGCLRTQMENKRIAVELFRQALDLIN